MYIDLINQHTPDSKAMQFSEPAAWVQIQETEEKLAVTFPAGLKKALFESNGVTGKYGLGLLWPIEKIISDNLFFKTHPDFSDLYMPFDHLLFFADAGNGDQFAYAIKKNGTIPDHDIFVWNHENDSRMWVAPDIGKYFEWCLTEKLAL